MQVIPWPAPPQGNPAATCVGSFSSQASGSAIEPRPPEPDLSPLEVQIFESYGSKVSDWTARTTAKCAFPNLPNARLTRTTPQARRRQVTRRAPIPALRPATPPPPSSARPEYRHQLAKVFESCPPVGTPLASYTVERVDTPAKVTRGGEIGELTARIQNHHHLAGDRRAPFQLRVPGRAAPGPAAARRGGDRRAGALPAGAPPPRGVQRAQPQFLRGKVVRRAGRRDVSDREGSQGRNVDVQGRVRQIGRASC